MDLGLQQKRVLITGGSRGIGYACAEVFAREGADVTIVGRTQSSVDAALQSLSNAHPGKHKGFALDLSDASSSDILRDAIASSDIVVNNAGAIPGGGLDRVDDESWRAAWDLKVYGYIDATRKALPAMLSRGSGVIVNVIGIAGAAPRYDYVSGSMANAALIAFTKATGAYAARSGVRVVGVNPGPTETDRLVRLYETRAEARFGDHTRWRELLGDMPFGRPAKPEEIADLVAFLASARASYLSGVVIDADGGAQYAG
ncbi:MAG: short-chain dehydrogenase/reductase [Burkholderia gladioli]